MTLTALAFGRGRIARNSLVYPRSFICPTLPKSTTMQETPPEAFALNARPSGNER